MSIAKYYARNKQELDFDNKIRDICHENGSKVEMALYLQGQDILSRLRRIEDLIEYGKERIEG